MTKQLNTYVVEGGVGKCVAFTALIQKLAKKAGQPIQIYTPYIGCFANNPNVKLAFEQTLPLTDPRIMASDNIFYSEPYKSNFQFGKQHLIEAYSKLHDIEFTKEMRPHIYTGSIADDVAKWLKDKEIKGDYILVQFTGGQSGWTLGQNTQYTNNNPNRNYPHHLAQTLINMIKGKYPDLTIIDCTLPNEPGYLNTIKCDMHWTGVHELMKEAKTFICIDTCMNHFSASNKMSGTVIWGSTRWIQFGYTHNTNLHFHMTDKWDETRFNPEDPRNPMVDPEIVFNSFINHYENPKDNVEVLCAS